VDVEDFLAIDFLRDAVFLTDLDDPATLANSLVRDPRFRLIGEDALFASRLVAFCAMLLAIDLSSSG
jgi:hypothetical protein